MTEKTNEELTLRVEQLERLVLSLIRNLGTGIDPASRIGFAWDIGNAVNPDTEFGKAWPERAKKMGLLPNS